MNGHGGRRPGSGAHPKPPLTRAELGRAIDNCALGNGGKITARGLVDAINAERTKGYVDPRSIRRLKVSTTWLREQRKMLKDSSFVGGEGLDSVVSGSVVFGHPKATDQMDKNGQPDGTTTAVQESPTISERDSDTGDSAVRTVVDSEQVVR